MARLLWLPTVLRAAGLTVREVNGWKRRGADSLGPIVGITCHATAGSRTATDDGELRVILNGSATAPAPIAQLYLSRTGTWHVVASGLCHHNLTGWAGPNKGYGNGNLIGVEAANDNRGEPWPPAQYRSYVQGVAALVRHLHIAVTRVAGHKEHQPYPPPPWTSSSKSDPTFDMGRFRTDVARTLAGEDNDMQLSDKVYEVAPGRPRTVDAILEAADTRTLATHNNVAAIVGQLTALRADVVAALGRDPVDEEALAEIVWARLPEQGVDKVAQILRAGMTSDERAELAARLTA